MKKVGICACYDNYNYGSMLQAYATQKAISEMGYENEFISYKKKKTIKFILKSIPRAFNEYFIHAKIEQTSRSKRTHKTKKKSLY